MTERGNDLCAVIRRAEETKDLDYKAPSAWDEADKKSCCEIVKDILAMSNTFGGHLVIGVSERDGHYVWEGLSDDQLQCWETTRLNQFVQRYADPPINVTMQRPVCDGKQYVVLTVPRFSTSPHICQKDFAGVLRVPGIYVRTANNQSAEIRTVSDMNDLLDHAVKNRQDQLVEALREVGVIGTGQSPEEALRRRKACLVIAHLGPIHGGDYNSIGVDLRNEGDYPARDVKVVFDTGDGFPPEPEQVAVNEILPGQTRSVGFRIRQPERDESNTPIPGQQRTVRLKVTFRDGLSTRDEAIFTIRLINGSGMWKPREDRQAARLSTICQFVRPEAG